VYNDVFAGVGSASDIEPLGGEMTHLTARARRALLGIVAVSAAATAAVLAPVPPAGAAPPPLPAPTSHGITLTGWSQVTAGEPASQPRLIDATVKTDRIFEPGVSPSINPTTVPIKVRILLPADYSTDPNRAYPVLYLLHGGGGGYADWSASGSGDVEDIVAASPFRGIVVMPEGGRAGWYSNWRGETDGRFSPQWEDFHVRQLVPWIDANFNTIEHRSGRAIAGLSMGGLGALAYGGRFTDVFSAVGAFSPGSDIADPSAQDTIAQSMWLAGASIGWTGLLDGTFRVTDDTQGRMETVFGPAGASGRWDSQNPIRMDGAYNAYDTRFGLYTGTGDGSGTDGEARLAAATDRLHAQLKANGVDHRYCRGPGTHEWSYWRPDLADFLAYAYGTTPGTCPNGWGAPTP
jgi:S-formylglutathione hydrolase FrmB